MNRLRWIVVIILLLVGGYGTARLVQRGQHEKRQRAIEQVETIEFALDRYAKDNGDYPSTDQGLASLWEYPGGQPMPVNWRGPYLDSPILVDPWDNAYMYRRPGVHDKYTYDLVSYGGDGVLGGRGDAEDVVSWLRPDEL